MLATWDDRQIGRKLRDQTSSARIVIVMIIIHCVQLSLLESPYRSNNNYSLKVMPSPGIIPQISDKIRQTPFYA